MAPMLKSDAWRVTHIYDNKYIVESDEYNARECKLLSDTHHYGYSEGWFGGCTQKLNFGIDLEVSGEVSNGWQLLPGSPLLFSERYMHLGGKGSDKWPDGFRFIPANGN